ncbi:hypothetical protein sscle_15g104690 [Sclerotinia sclerotiorum 1980 UF-70]|uniref:Uncharacterized protein n=2 Tax=Sclerotinia sclerotiorum (strain ATCC 18683 / 1980 / Ss-1) TaxID=665079 RepID=A0A1D9QLE9_SCLS1|nr:hypothetical protein sscle_15g104690 [Sclerotinia sclerotiorum 1980 UF-70]
MKGGFTPLNTIGSTDAPNFKRRNKTTNTNTRIFKQQHNFKRVVNTSRTTTPSHIIPRIQRTTCPSPVTENSPSLSELGDSTSLFDSSLLIIGRASNSNSAGKGTVVVLDTTKYDRYLVEKGNKMVREISPAKVQAPRPEEPKDQYRSSQSNAANHLSNIPRFGEATLPQSPLNRKSQQQYSELFIQPKSRPEFHRDTEKHTHPHLQAAKDAARKIIDPFMPRAPADYNKPAVRAPVPGSSSYATTHPAPQPTFGSLPNSNGGFQSINTYTSNNYVDLTTSKPNYNETHIYVDPAKAQEDLKALLEGVIEDEEDTKPRTRSRRKKKDAEVDDLMVQMNGLNVESDEKLEVASEDEEEDDGTVEGINVKLLPHQVEGLEWMIGREIGTGKRGIVPKGGILADDMGLGKTLQSISLILSNPKPSSSDETRSKRKLPSGLDKCTLVVAPLALIRQWEAEIKDKVESSHSLRVCVHHGPQRTKRFQDLRKYDVVITTYQILVSEWGNSSKDDDDEGVKVGCFGIHWYRVILDEAHTIKNRNAKATQACYSLRSHYRWCLTGTPMQNNLDELQSLIKFLRIKPYDNLREWKDQIDRPMKNGRGDVAIKRLRHYLQIFMKRRTKEILKKEGALNPGGKPSVAGQANSTGFKVVERKIEKVFAEFSPEERKFYERLEARTDASIEEMMGGSKVNYASALVLLLRLRQACNHPKLVGNKLGKDTDALSAETSNAKSKSTTDFDEMADMFGSLGVGSKKCEVCQIGLGKEAISQGAIRCLDCEADLDEISGKKLSPKKKTKEERSKKDKKHKASKPVPIRKPRNRNIIEDSDDEEEGEWLVGDKKRGALTLGKAGGKEDENCEGGGEWLDSDHDSDLDDSFPDIKDIGKKKVVSLDSDDEETADESFEESEEEDSEEDESSEEEEEETDVEDEFGSSDEEAELSRVAASTKITHLMKILGKEAAQHKFIVFSQFTSMLDLVEPFLRQKGFKYTRYDGGMKNDLREASLDRLRNDENCRVLLCSLKCGSLGLNLTAATRVVILEPFWNPFVEEQAIDRVHRLTQKIDVVVYKITIKDTVEERILLLQEKKRELANQTIEGGKGGAGKLGMKEILQLFRRDAEQAPPATGAYDLGAKPRILKESASRSPSKSAANLNSYGSQTASAPRKIAPTPFQAKKIEDSVYGRRW